MSLSLRLKTALEQDSTISVPRSELKNYRGFTVNYLTMLGLQPRDLKKLEKLGVAIRGRLPTKAYDVLGKEREAGHELRWLIMDEGVEKYLG